MNKITHLEKKILVSNFISLSFLKGVNYILPLITFPYLVRVIGIDNFGLLSFVTAIMMYFSIIVSYGFDLTATRSIAVNKENKENIIEIYSSVLIIKFLLMIISFFILMVIVFLYPKMRVNYELYILAYGMIVGQVFFPIWFFQGMEKMKYITYMNIISKGIFTLAIFIFIHNKNDYYLVPLFTSMGYIIVGFISIYIIKYHFLINFKMQSFGTIKYYFKDGWHIFLSRFYLNLYTTTNIVLLGIFTNNIVVGYFSIAEKIVQAIGGLFQPANQTLFPYLSKKYIENKIHFINMIKRISKYYVILSIIFIIISFIFRNEIILLINGSSNEDIVKLFTILLLGIIIHPFGALLSNILVIEKQNKKLISVMNYTVLINFSIVPVSIYFYSALGLAYASLVVVYSHIILLFLKIRRIFND